MWWTYLALVAPQSADIHSWKNQQLCTWSHLDMLLTRHVLHAFQNMGTIANILTCNCSHILTWSTWPPARCTSWKSAALLCRAHRAYKVQLYNFFINFIRKVIDNICEHGDHNVYDCHLTSAWQLHTTQQSLESSSSCEQKQPWWAIQLSLLCRARQFFKVEITLFFSRTIIIL